ncbi:hypothetical protein BDN70DRAFT_971819 [Pholiota conissans]|uniref:Uncharacterized protein n=1 Tax=Pholiota conissans TaxID=109636 RepID=A0A9P5Z5T5_9AGAR|nr:hypothetical protein BDN70DRAFT_971819 [Pholiota conissans]
MMAVWWREDAAPAAASPSYSLRTHARLRVQDARSPTPTLGLTLLANAGHAYDHAPSPRYTLSFTTGFLDWGKSPMQLAMTYKIVWNVRSYYFHRPLEFPVPRTANANANANTNILNNHDSDSPWNANPVPRN